MDATRKGKIATLPAKIRDEINRRLHEGKQVRQNPATTGYNLMGRDG